MIGSLVGRLGIMLAAISLLAADARGQIRHFGTGMADITPKGPIWLAGYGNRNKPSEGVDQPLRLKVLALRADNDAPLLLITADLIGFPRVVTDKIAERIGKEFRVPRENILVIASHTHTGPVIEGRGLGMFDLRDKDADAVKAYTARLPDAAFEAAAAALGNMQPGRISFGRGRATFAVNRRVFRSGGVAFGANRDGAVDYDVPVLRIDDTDGSVRAIVFGYACHCTTLIGTHYRISGDWAGYAQEFLERAFPQATGLFATGCGADADPQPRGKLDFARQHGLEMAGAVAQALKDARTPIAGSFKAAFGPADLPFANAPTREEFQKRLQDPNPFVQRHARRQLQILETDGKLPTSYPCPVQAWQLGPDLTLVALGGEVVVDYALRLKRELPQGNLWVAAYANDVFAYVPSVRILLEGGYEADFAMIYYGLPTRFANGVEEVLVKKVHELVKRVRG